MKLRLAYLILAIATFIGAMVLLPSHITATPVAESAHLRTINDARITEIEQTWKTQYADYLTATAPSSVISGHEIRTTLSRLDAAAQSQFALVYVVPQDDYLELMLVMPGESPLQVTISEAPLATFSPVLDEFQFQTSHPTQSGRSLEAAQQLYRWMIEPLKPTLEKHAVRNLIFCVGTGVRSAPLAALHDGQQFLVERYGISVIPAFSLTDLRYDRVANTRILAMGASEFDQLNDLPAVPVELSAIAQGLWNGEIFLNQDFTQANLSQQLDSGQFAIVHLATHAAFKSGSAEESYIQLWQDDRLQLPELPDLGWSDRPIELLVLSACQTALGDREAELGFAGLSFQTGVKSTLASLWRVDDVGTLALMHEFYRQLSYSDVTTKSEALRRAQVEMLHGAVQVEDNQIVSSGESLPLPLSLKPRTVSNLSNPYYWAGFTLVGSPW